MSKNRKAIEAKQRDGQASIAKLIEVAPRLAQRLRDLAWCLRFERLNAAINAASLPNGIKLVRDPEGVPHILPPFMLPRGRGESLEDWAARAELAEQPWSREQWEEELTRQTTLLRELAQEVMQDWLAFAPAFKAQRRELAGLIHRPFFECGSWAKQASACELLFRIMEAVAEMIQPRTRFSPNSFALRSKDIGAHWRDEGDWEELRQGVEVEIAELQRRHPDSDPLDKRGLSNTAFAFLRVLVEENGKRLGFQDIFLAAQKRDPVTFKGAAPNRRQQDAIRGLIGHIADGKVVRGTTGHGRRCEFWIEPAMPTGEPRPH